MAKELIITCVDCNRKWRIDNARGLAVLALIGKWGFQDLSNNQWRCKDCKEKHLKENK